MSKTVTITHIGYTAHAEIPLEFRAGGYFPIINRDIDLSVLSGFKKIEELPRWQQAYLFDDRFEPVDMTLEYADFACWFLVYHVDGDEGNDIDGTDYVLGWNEYRESVEQAAAERQYELNGWT